MLHYMKWIKLLSENVQRFNIGVCVCLFAHARVLSYVQFFVALWTVACQASLSTEFSRQEYWDKLPFPTPGDPWDPVIKPMSLVSLALACRVFTTALVGKPKALCTMSLTHLSNLISLYPSNGIDTPVEEEYSKPCFFLIPSLHLCFLKWITLPHLLWLSRLYTSSD